jgi:AP-1-like factor
MDTYPTEISPLWDLSQASSFSQLPDDDFLALLQKQFPTSAGPYGDFGGMPNGVNPQTISRYPLPTLTPPSEDSSPSPQQSGSKSPEDEHDLKRKASDDDLSDGPSQKTQHTCMWPFVPQKHGIYLRSGQWQEGHGDEAQVERRRWQRQSGKMKFT